MWAEHINKYRIFMREDSRVNNRARNGANKVGIG